MSTSGLLWFLPSQKNRRFPSISVFPAFRVLSDTAPRAAYESRETFRAPDRPGGTRSHTLPCARAFPHTPARARRPGAAYNPRFFLHAQRADHCRKQKQHEHAERGEQNIAYDSHAAVSFRERRYRKYATPMAIAPEGNIIKLVEPSSPGTRMKSTLIRTSGQSAIFMFFR